MADRTWLDRAGWWFLRSGIQEPSGAVARYYRSDLRRNAAASTEITAYAIQAFLFLAQRTSDPAYLEAAIACGRFLTRTAWDPKTRTFPFECAADGRAPQAYFFDCGIIARGLAALWGATRDSEFREAAVACARSMAVDFAAGCAFHPVIELPDKTPAEHEPRWSRQPGCYQLKAALGWLQVDEAQFGAKYLAALAFARADDAAFLPGAAEPERVMDRLHAYCYFLEGLLPSAKQCGPVLARGIERVARALGEIGPVFERSDVYAQLLRLRLYADALEAAPLDRAAADAEARTLLSFQLESADGREDGAFCFGRKGAEMLPYANPVSTAFAIQALTMWENGQFAADWKTLI